METSSPKRVIGIGEQRAHMQLLYPDFKIFSSKQGMSWRGTLQPTTISDKYEVEIVYTPPGSPHVKVLSPPLSLPQGRSSLPHVYCRDELCLYFPGEWTAEKHIADLIPWISEWLLFYEGWRAVGKWSGGGIPPEAH